MEFKTNLMNQFQLSEVEADQIVYFLQMIGTELSKMTIIFIPFLITGHLAEYGSILILTLILRSQSGGFHFKRYLSCLVFSFIYFITVLFLTKIAITNTFLIALGIAGCVAISWLSPMLSPQRKKLKRINVSSLKYRSIAIALIYTVLFLIKSNPFTRCAVWVVIIQGILLMIQKGVLYVKR